MLKPSMNELMARVNNRYLLVNLAAQRARDLSDESEESGEKLPDKAVKLALDEIADGEIVYCEGPRIVPEPEEPPVEAEEALPVDGTEETPEGTAGVVDTFAASENPQPEEI